MLASLSLATSKSAAFSQSCSLFVTEQNHVESIVAAIYLRVFFGLSVHLLTVLCSGSTQGLRELQSGWCCYPTVLHVCLM